MMGERVLLAKSILDTLLHLIIYSLIILEYSIYSVLHNKGGITSSKMCWHSPLAVILLCEGILIKCQEGRAV